MLLWRFFVAYAGGWLYRFSIGTGWKKKPGLLTLELFNVMELLAIEISSFKAQHIRKQHSYLLLLPLLLQADLTVRSNRLIILLFVLIATTSTLIFPSAPYRRSKHLHTHKPTMAKKLSEGRKPGSGRKPGKAKTLAEGRKPGSGRPPGKAKTLADGRKPGSGRRTVGKAKESLSDKIETNIQSILDGAAHLNSITQRSTVVVHQEISRNTPPQQRETPSSEAHRTLLNNNDNDNQFRQTVKRLLNLFRTAESEAKEQPDVNNTSSGQQEDKTTTTYDTRSNNSNSTSILQGFQHDLRPTY